MDKLKLDEAVNVLGRPLELCGSSPLTGFVRDGYCNTCAEDLGSHTVCVKVDQRFLEYSRFRGNDLSTPMLNFQFPGLQAGDSWCLCASRWLEAYEHDMAPPVWLARTHIKALDIVSLDILKTHAADEHFE